MLRRALLPLLAACAALPAAAQSPWYAGLSGGISRTSHELVRNRESTITDAVDLRTDFDDEDGAWKAFAGFRLNRVIALEVSYYDLGSHRMDTRLGGGIPSEPARIVINRGLSGYAIDVVATAPLETQRVRLFGRAGHYRARIEADATLEGAIVFNPGNPEERFRRTSRTHEGFKLGVGLDVHMTRNIAVRGEIEHFAGVGRAFRIGGRGTTGKADTNLASLGVVWSF